MSRAIRGAGSARRYADLYRQVALKRRNHPREFGVVGLVIAPFPKLLTWALAERPHNLTGQSALSEVRWTKLRTASDGTAAVLAGDASVTVISGRTRIAGWPWTSRVAMRVLHIGKFYLPFRGGIESHLHALCRELTKSISVNVIVAERNAAPDDKRNQRGKNPALAAPVQSSAPRPSVRRCPREIRNARPPIHPFAFAQPVRGARIPCERAPRAGS